MTKRTTLSEWETLSARAAALSKTHLRLLFEKDPARFEAFSLDVAGLFFDYSKNKIDAEVMADLFALARAVDLAGARKRMFAGEKINVTENRAVLHVALRDFAMRDYHIDGQNLSSAVRAELAKIKTFVEAIHQGKHKGFTGEPIDKIINIGIGGSDLGPKMATTALRPFWHKKIRSEFVSNVDGQHLTDALEGADPARTLFIIASKTFTTEETMTNAQSARAWFLENGGAEADVAKHFVALSTNEAAVTQFGIEPQNMFVFWDWVGGRFSMWSAIGLSIALQVGYDNFEDLLRGAHKMDEHFRIAPLEENMPALMALVGVWNRNFMGAGAHAVLPYDEHLGLLPSYLQQADMESNGKARRLDGTVVDCETGPVIFGEPGTNGQHAFYQLLHQGTDIISADFIAPALSQSPLGDHHEKLLANFLAQTEALMLGKTEDEVRCDLEQDSYGQEDIDALAPHKVFDGDRPTNSILFERLTPETLGALIALYEHKIFCQGVIWGVNSFDQWGVELGKVLAKEILPDIAACGEEKPEVSTHDASTNGLLNKINAMRAAAVKD